jgi:hypothetical protein
MDYFWDSIVVNCETDLRDDRYWNVKKERELVLEW